jgi:hypothetical protein
MRNGIMVDIKTKIRILRIYGAKIRCFLENLVFGKVIAIRHAEAIDINPINPGNNIVPGG